MGSLVFNGYKIATTLVAPLLLPAFLLSKRGRRRIDERYGFWKPVQGNPIWFHGASVGEVRGIEPIVSGYLRRVGPAETLLTATSPTAIENQKVCTSDRLSPLDAPFAVQKALAVVNPKAYIFGETELWPILLQAFSDRTIPVHLVNGRISDYTFSHYVRFKGLFSPLLANFRSLSVVSQEAASRFEALGALRERIRVTGNAKYDSRPSVTSREGRDDIRRLLFPRLAPTIPIVVLGSLRPGEEEVWLEAYKKYAGRIAVVLAPRHAEKFPYFIKAIESASLQFDRFSQTERNPGASLLLLDTMGFLERAYSVSSLAFIGATLVNVGGHNPLEAAQYGVPVCVGPYTSVIRDVVSDLESESALYRVTSVEDVTEVLELVANYDVQLSLRGERGQRVAERHRGATDAIVEHILAS